MLGVIFGAGMTGWAVVHAAIPDSNGTIHGCRNTTTTLLRVIDSASQNCDSNETGLNWDQDGVKGYGRITLSSSSFSMDTTRSKNISNLYTVAVGEEDTTYIACFTASSTPKTVMVTPESWGGFTPGVAIKDGNGWTIGNGVGNVCDSNGTGANVAVVVPVGAAQSVLFSIF